MKLLVLWLAGLIGSWAQQPLSKNERCGKDYGNSLCDASLGFGQCCSSAGWCGSTPDHCLKERECQSGCEEPKPDTKPNTCGNGICDKNSETCFSCPEDCGECDNVYLDKCVKNGDIALTFDDGPSEFTPLLLKKTPKNIKLTLFVIGNKLKNVTYQRYLKQAFDAGHTIASHTYSHPFVTKLSDDEIRQEMIKTDDAIFEIIGKRPIFMRNPYSDSNERTMSLFQSMGYKSIFTSLDSEDTVYGDSNPPKILTNVKEGLKNNSPLQTGLVLTQHETFKVSVDYLPKIINEINRRKFKIVSISQCFGVSSPYQ